MGVKIGEVGNYSIIKDQCIFKEGQDSKSLTILLKGLVDVYLNNYRIFSVDKNIIIGATDLFLKEKYSFSYIAAEDSNIYAYPIKGIDDLRDLLYSQKEYFAFTLLSMAAMMDHLHSALIKMEQRMTQLYNLSVDVSFRFWDLKDKYNLTYMPSSPYLNEMQGKVKRQEDFTDDILGYTSLDSISKNKLKYYQQIKSLPLRIRKDFFSADEYIAFYHFNDAAQFIDKIKNHIETGMEISEKYFKEIYLEGKPCIFYDYISLIKEAKKYNQDWDEILCVLGDISSKIIQTAKDYNVEYHYDLGVDTEYIIKLKNQIMNRVGPESTYENNSIETKNIPEELADSAEKIIRYSEIHNEKADLFRSCLMKFRKDPGDRSMSKDATELFFEIYEMVFKKVLVENNNSILFSMFLDYGYMDEQLLTIEELLALYKLSDPSLNDGPCKVYSMKEWLIKIYKMEIDPSVNEFDQDYFDVFREMKKRGEVSEGVRIKYEKDRDARLKFEINNMFKMNHKLCYGQTDTYFPILHSGMIQRDLYKAIILKDKINQVIKQILEIDYSAFYRELIYQNPEKGIEKEIIYKSVEPDIILMPTFGSRGIMWQEITGRIRSAPGRFILPMFTCEDLEKMLVKLIGSFRFELCRTMMGIAWNDITVDSLTSEYTDYIQFYRKNKELSEEAKEKLRNQIYKHNNRIKDLFIADYKTWIKYEHKGYIRLNKIARSILYKYCPFSKSIRENLEKQPLFNEIAIPFNTARNKQVKELERRYKKLFEGDDIQDKELKENLRFYKEL